MESSKIVSFVFSQILRNIFNILDKVKITYFVFIYSFKLKDHYFEKTLSKNIKENRKLSVDKVQV